MAIATPFYEKTDEQKAIIEMVRQFVDEQIIPKAEHYDGADEYPEPIVEQMKELGLFGVTIPEEHGGMGLDLTTYTMIVEELKPLIDRTYRTRPDPDSTGIGGSSLGGSGSPYTGATTIEVGYTGGSITGGGKRSASLGKPVEWSPKGLPTRIVGTDTDITQRKLAEAEKPGACHVEVPEDVEQAETLRNPRSGFIAYVPPGSIAVYHSVSW